MVASARARVAPAQLEPALERLAAELASVQDEEEITPKVALWYAARHQAAL
jgi:hypothetical protein